MEPPSPRRPVKPTRRPLPPLAAALLLVAGLASAGCLGGGGEVEPYRSLEGFRPWDDPAGLDPGAWPDLEGQTLTILDNGAFASFDQAAAQFEKLTGVKVTKEDGGDGVGALKKLKDAKADGSYDVIYGLDNMILGQAVKDDLLVPYEPIMAQRIAPDLQFLPDDAPWYATPTDHGYIAVNYDAGNTVLEGKPVRSYSDLRRFADEFATQDPRTSTPGLGFLLATIVAFPEGPEGAPRYDWKDYWTDLFTGAETDRDRDGEVAGCVTVTQTWFQAYSQFTAAGSWVGDAGRNKAIVTSYTNSPAFETYADPEMPNVASLLLAANTTFHQVQTMAIAKGTQHEQAAQAWIEFTLTDFFQGLSAPVNGIYPVVPKVFDVTVPATYGGVDPAFGSFRDARMSYATINANLERWTQAWVDLYEEHNCAGPSL